MMHKNRLSRYAGIVCISSLVLTACKSTFKLPTAINKTGVIASPQTYNNLTDTTNEANIVWQKFFTDPNLNALIDTALRNNQEYNMVLQEVLVAKTEVQSRKGEYLPFLNVGTGVGAEKSARYTRNGAVEANVPIKPGQQFPGVLPDFLVGGNVSWEVDIWRKLRNARDAANQRYLSTDEGRKFMKTQLVSEIANSYYELMALDNKLEILKQNIEIQTNALQIVKLQKTAGMVTELAVRKFEAEVYKNQSSLYYIQQLIIQTENKINFLAGRYPQPIQRNSQSFTSLVPDSVSVGIPSQLLDNRPDIKQAEMQLIAANLDIKVTKANFYPTLMLSAGAGFQAFNPKYLLATPESILMNLAGGLVAPLVNRNAIKAKYHAANYKQVQAIYNYERSILNAYVEVVNRLSNSANLKKSYDLKSLQVQALTQSITISTSLFKSAQADYMEVLMTQRDAVESRFELIETKQLQLNNWVNIYKALGGGWKQ